MPPEIVVIADTAAGAVQPATYELLACARLLSRIEKASVRVIAVGAAAESMAAEIARTGRCDVTALVVPGLNEFNGDIHRRVLEVVLGENRPRLICAAHSSRGIDFAPGLAARLGAACISGIESIAVENGRPVFIRAVFGGKFAARVTTSAAAVVLTILPGCFRAEPPENAGAGRVEKRRLACPPSRSRTTGVQRPEAVEGGIEEAEVIVAAGKGIGDPERLDLIRGLAGLFAKSAVAGSRIACDQGWIEYRRQVGVTGRTVCPKLYFACGISGAVQHVMGMRGSGFVVAVNTDPTAPIFREADVGIVDDLTEFIPEFLRQAEK
jgi:electron transfer flavoprotein alpha subunit